jgi:putative transposase
MPREQRHIDDYGYYHILTRGNDKKIIFRCEADYDHFIEIIKKYLNKFQVQIFHYCLMPNHLHLLLQAIKAEDLPKFMQGVLQVYGSYFRIKYGSVGFTYQNRYKSIPIDKECYLLECARYIERNPLRAKIVENLNEYPWSSFSYYAQGTDNDIIKEENPLYIQLSMLKEARQRLYIEYILQKRPYDHVIDEAFKIG